MPRTGRNDLCPCGSGRKYKQCCLPKDRAAQARVVNVRRDDEFLWARLFVFGQRPAYSVDLQSSFSRFWNGDFDLEAAQPLQGPQLLPFLEWYLYDYRTSKDRQRLVDLFAAEEGPRMSPEQRALLAEREASYPSLYGIEAIEPDGRLEVGDLLAGGFYVIEDLGLARLAMPGDLLFGRRYGDGAAARMSRGTVLLPGALGPGLVAAAKRAYGAYREEHYGALWPEFLRENGYVMYHYLLTSEADEAYARAPRREGYFDPRAAVEQMHAIMRRRAEEAARQQAAEEEKRRQEAGEQPVPGPVVERTAGGILIPGQPKPSPSAERGILLPGDVRSG